MRRLLALVACFATAGVLSASRRQDVRSTPSIDDAAIRALVDRFFATQVAEDAEAYLALWSGAAERPAPAQLKFIFDSGDDLFMDVRIMKVTGDASRATVRVSAVRNRTDTSNRRPDGSFPRFTTPLLLALALVKENGEWKIAAEGSPADTLASQLIAAPTGEARAALMDADPDLLGEMLVTSLSRAASTQATRGDFAAAKDIYARIVELAQRTGNRRAEAQAYQGVGNAAYFRRDFRAAADAYRRRLAVERAAENNEGIAEALVGIATVQYSEYEYADALITYREAAALQERLGDHNALGMSLISTGNVQLLQGAYDEAIADYRRSRELLRKTFNLGGVARALEGLGRAYTAQGNYAAALEAFDGVLREGRARKAAPMIANALLNIGDVHVRLGNLESARTAYGEGRVEFERARDVPAVGHVWQALGRVELIATRFAPAEDAYRKAIAVCEGAKEPECVARATVGLAFAQSAQEHYDEAIATYRKAIDAFTMLGRELDAARAETGLSQAYLGRKSPDLALAAAARARDTAVALHDDDVLWRATAAQARALRRLGSADKAMLAAREAVVILERRTHEGAANPAVRAPADGVSAFALLAVLQAEASDAAGALVTLEARRAYALRVALAGTERDIWRGMTLAERDEERTLAAAVVSLAVRIEQERSLPKPDAQRVASLEKRLAEAVAARERQQQKLFERLPALRAWRGLAAPPSLPDLLAVLPPSTTAIELAIDEDDVVAVTAVPGTDGPALAAHTRAVRRQEVANKVAALALDAATDGDAWRRAAQDLAGVLPEAVPATLGSATSLLVIPDDVLWRLPMEALPSGAGYAADGRVIRYASSLASLRSATSSTERGAGLTAVAAPELSPERLDRVRATSPGWTPRPPEGARDEVQRLAARFDGATIAAGSEATESALRARSASALFLHVAAPFRVNGASPLFSRVYLSSPVVTAEGTPAPEDDGALDCREVFNLDARARVVVFSDGTAAGMRDAAAAWPLVHWAWKAAGVPLVLTTRWQTDSAVATAMLDDFYSGIERGEEPHAALAAAQARLRAREETRAPQAWAGWVLIGG